VLAPLFVLGAIAFVIFVLIPLVSDLWWQVTTPEGRARSARIDAKLEHAKGVAHMRGYNESRPRKCSCIKCDAVTYYNMWYFAE
jgi:hypothetical protein